MTGLKGTVILPAWKIYGASDEIFEISIGGDMVMENPVLSVEHVNAYNYLIKYSAQIQETLLTQLIAVYKDWQDEYGYDKSEAKEIMPDLDHVEQFKKLIRLRQIHIMNASRDKFAYVGYEFSCSWDDEHGLGFMTHKNRVIDFGGADMSFMTWVAEQDLDS